MGGTGILGGTFNPVHTGHIRHALEVGEALGLDRVLLTPSAVPPHKSDAGLLPFALRVDLLAEAVDGIPLLGVNTMECELSGPSYTYVSLQEWRKRHPKEDKPFFLMGAEDFGTLDNWYHGLDLPLYAHLVVVPRAGSERDIFHANLEKFWPGSLVGHEPVIAEADGKETVRLSNGGECTFLCVPRLDISASFVRVRWLQNRSIHGLVPEGVRKLLESRRQDVCPIWSGAW